MTVISSSAVVQSIRSLQNGIDLRGIRPNLGSPDGPLLEPETAFWIGFGFGRWLSRTTETTTKRPIKIGIGLDSRLSGVDMTIWLAGGLKASNVDVYSLGLCTTPSMFYACSSNIVNPLLTGIFPLDGGIVITASHLPKHWNGFKMFTPTTPINIGQQGIDAIIAEVEATLTAQDIASIPKPHAVAIESINRAPFMSIYSKYLQETIFKYSADSRNLKPLLNTKICVNAGNGVGGFFASCLAELGCDVSGSVHLEPDGNFPNHVANPEDPVAIATTAHATISSRSDLGVCLDTDADRVGLVDHDGSLFNRNRLIALVSKIATEDYYHSHIEAEKKPIIVTDSATSTGLHSYIETTLNSHHLRYKKGYRYVIDLARNTEHAIAAVECSGHGAWLENGWVDDGCYTAARVIAALIAKRSLFNNPSLTLKDMTEGLIEPVESIEIRLKMLKGDKETRAIIAEKAVAAFQKMADSLPHWTIDPVNYEGIRAEVDWSKYSAITQVGGGWCMIRPSLHEPILSLQMESDIAGGVQFICRELLAAFVSSEDELISVLDLSNLRKEAGASSMKT